MDLKGIELTGALLTSTDQAARRKRRQKGLIKPVAKMDKTLLAQILRTGIPLHLRLLLLKETTQNTEKLT